MKLVLPIPDDWKRLEVEGGILYEAPSQMFGMFVTPLGGAHAEPESWIQEAFLYRHEGDGELRDLRFSQHLTAQGWGVAILDGGLGTQARFVAYMAFLDYSATVVGMCRNPEEHPTWREQLLAIVLQATPDFSDSGVACLAQLLGGPPAPSEKRLRKPMTGWRRSFCGGDLVLTDERGASAGTIRVTSHVTPVQPVNQIFADMLEATADELVVELPAIDLSDEGEHIAFARATTPNLQHTIGVVFADAHYTWIEALVRDPSLYEKFGTAVRELAYSTTLGLGRGRWRRFYYEPPPGWVGVPRPRGAMWISPACPVHHQLMRVFDARPPADHESVHGARMYETLPMEFYRQPPKGPVSYWTADDLECQVVVHTAWLPNRVEPIRVLDGIIKTDDYIYPIRMECDQAKFEESAQVFERVVASFRPVPERRKVDLDVSTAVEFWVG